MRRRPGALEEHAGASQHRAEGSGRRAWEEDGRRCHADLLSDLPDRLRTKGTVDDVDLRQLHSLVLAGERSLHTLAHAARIRPRDVSLVIAAHPPDSPIFATRPVDWSQIRADLPETCFQGTNARS